MDKRKKAETVEVIVAALEQEQTELLERLNLQSDAIVSNQCCRNAFCEIEHGDHRVKWMDLAERGVGLNRNNAWMRSGADVVLLADDDMTYFDGYPETVLRLFNENPKADVIIFNISETVPTRKVTEKAHYTRKCGYGAARFAIRREPVQKKGLSFNLHFGGGAEYSHGEDTLFLSDCNAKGLHVRVVPETIAKLNDTRGSTWNSGYTDERFFDDGVLLAAQRIRLLNLRKVIAAYRSARRSNRKFIEVYRSIDRGIKHFRSIYQY